MPSIARLIIVPLLLSGLSLLVSCNGDDDNGVGPGISRPTVTATSPWDRAQFVARDAVIRVSFSRDMDSTSLVDSTLVLNPPVNGTFVYSDSVLMFTPSVLLDSAVTYTATVRTLAKDTSGVALAQDYVWQFATHGPVVLDPDEGHDRDISRVYAHVIDSILEVRVETNGSWTFYKDENEGIDLALYFDTDRDRATGDTSTNILGTNYSIADIGADYLIVIGNHGDTLYRWIQPPGFAGVWRAVHGINGFASGFLFNDTNVFEIGTYLSNLGNPTDSIDMIAVNVLLPLAAVDFAPDAGHVTVDVTVPSPLPGSHNLIASPFTEPASNPSWPELFK